MRRPRDYDAELKALDDRAKQLKARKVAQLGELVIATGADALPVELLAGALLGAVAERKADATEAWLASGAAWFQRTSRRAGGASDGAGGATKDGGRAAPASGRAGSQ